MDKGKEQESVPEPAPAMRRLVISITQTEDEESDSAYLNKLVTTLKEFPGGDTVSLRVTNEEKVITLKLADLGVNYGPELHEQLVALVGEEGLHLETG